MNHLLHTGTDNNNNNTNLVDPNSSVSSVEDGFEKLSLDIRVREASARGQTQQTHYDCFSKPQFTELVTFLQRRSLDTRRVQKHLPRQDDINPSADRVAQTRAAIFRSLEARLKVRCNAQDEGVVAKTANFLEQRLFQSAKTLQEYADFSTLDARIRVVSAVKLNQRLTNKARQTRRAQVLRQTLGGTARYREAQRLIQDIRSEKQMLVAMHLQCAGGSETPTTTNLSTSASCRRSSFSLNKSIPDPVRDLYFDTSALLNAFEKSPLESLHRFHWETLLKRGSATLAAYREWTGDSC